MLTSRWDLAEGLKIIATSGSGYIGWFFLFLIPSRWSYLVLTTGRWQDNGEMAFIAKSVDSLQGVIMVLILHSSHGISGYINTRKQY
jgi:hypothetical protein